MNTSTISEPRLEGEALLERLGIPIKGELTPVQEWVIRSRIYIESAARLLKAEGYPKIAQSLEELITP